MLDKKHYPNSNRVTFCILIALLIALLLSPAIASPPKPMQQLLASIEKIRKQENIAAIGLSFVEKGGHVWSGGLGTLSHDSKIPVTEDTIFRIGSITKSFTSLATLTLLEKNQLSLNDKISHWIPQLFYHNQWRQTHPIKVADLLEHTAGFRDISKAEFDFNESDPIPLSQTLKRYKDYHRTAWKPGKHSSYSNLGAAYSGFIIEQISKQSFESFIIQTLFKPLQMKHSGFFIDNNNTAQLAAGYNTNGITPIPYWHMVYRSFGGINSTPSDMSHFIQMLIHKGNYQEKQIFKTNSILRMEIPQSTLAAKSGLTFGYGLGNYQWLRNGILFHGHGGDADGYLSHYGYTRSNNSGYFVVVTAFNHQALRKIKRLIEQYLIENVPEPHYPKEYPINQLSLKKISGVYRKITSRFGNDEKTMRVIVDGNSIYTQNANEKKIRLIPVNKMHFRRKYETLPTIAIIQTADGEVYFQDDRDNFQKMPLIK